MAADNIRYKDRLFTFLFGSEENKAWTLSLYNAVNNSDFDMNVAKRIISRSIKMD